MIELIFTVGLIAVTVIAVEWRMKKTKPHHEVIQQIKAQYKTITQTHDTHMKRIAEIKNGNGKGKN